MLCYAWKIVQLCFGHEPRSEQSLQHALKPDMNEHAMSCTEEQGQAACWACGTTVTLPHQNGVYAQMYKCGWCGAITRSRAPAKQRFETSIIFR